MKLMLESEARTPTVMTSRMAKSVQVELTSLALMLPFVVAAIEVRHLGMGSSVRAVMDASVSESSAPSP